MATSGEEKQGKHLPDGLVWEILTRLPVKTLMRFKCVSRRWLSIILDPSFAKVHRSSFHGLLISQPILQRLAVKRNFFYVSLLGDSKLISHHLTVDHCYRRMGSTDVVNGLVCFYDRNRSSLYNLATRETVELPASVHKAQACNYHLGFDPVGNLYKLLKICPIYEDYDEFAEENANFVGNLECEILTLGVDSSWRSINPAPMEITSRSVCFDGVLYWMQSRDSDVKPHLIAFHLGREKFQFIPTPDSTTACYLPLFGPRLALISVSSNGLGSETVILYYADGEPGLWTEHRFNLPNLDGGIYFDGYEHHSYPRGMLPNADWEPGVWAENGFNLLPNEIRVVGYEHHFHPKGMLPDGKVLILDNFGTNHRRCSYYLYDQTERKLEKIVICNSRSTSSSASSIVNEKVRGDVFGYMSYFDEENNGKVCSYAFGCLSYFQGNIISLNSLIDTP